MHLVQPVGGTVHDGLVAGLQGAELDLADGTAAPDLVPELCSPCGLDSTQESGGLISAVNKAKASLSWSRLREVSERRNRH